MFARAVTNDCQNENLAKRSEPMPALIVISVLCSHFQLFIGLWIYKNEGLLYIMVKCGWSLKQSTVCNFVSFLVSSSLVSWIVLRGNKVPLT